MPKNSLFGDLVSDGEVNATASVGYGRQVLSVHLAEMMQRQGLTKRQMVEKLNINDEAQLDALLDPQSENLLFETFGRAVSNIGYTVKISLVGLESGYRENVARDIGGFLDEGGEDSGHHRAP